MWCAPTFNAGAWAALVADLETRIRERGAMSDANGFGKPDIYMVKRCR